MKVFALCSGLLIACSSTSNPMGDDDQVGDDDDVDPTPDGGTMPESSGAELGTGDHSPGSVTLVEVIGDQALATPMDLSFDPMSGSLWIVNQYDDTWAIVDPSVSPATFERYQDDSNHFLRRPSSLSFIPNSERVLATCQESNNGGDGFMGPVAWTSDPARFEGGTNSHYDMLHESNNCMGIAWQAGHQFWVFNGTDGVIDRVDFHGWHPDAPHGLGGEDHTDGEYFRYSDARVRRVAGVAAGMQVDDGLLYVADTGNGRIARMPTNGAIGEQMESRFGEVPMYSAGGELTDVVTDELVQPSGLAIKGGLLFVGDRATGILYAFDKSGTKVNWLDTGLGASHVGSLDIGPDGKLYFLDTPGNKLYRVEP